MALVWNDGLAVGVEVMDADHRTLLLLLQRFPGASDPDFVDLFDQVANHLDEHFERENQLMRQHTFFAYHCHHGEHESVLQRVRALQAEAGGGDTAAARAFIADEIEPWFINHRDTMDWVTAQFISSRSPTR